MTPTGKPTIYTPPQGTYPAAHRFLSERLFDVRVSHAANDDKRPDSSFPRPRTKVSPACGLRYGWGEDITTPRMPFSLASKQGTTVVAVNPSLVADCHVAWAAVTKADNLVSLSGISKMHGSSTDSVYQLRESELSRIVRLSRTLYGERQTCMLYPETPLHRPYTPNVRT